MSLKALATKLATLVREGMPVGFFLLDTALPAPKEGGYLSFARECDDFVCPSERLWAHTLGTST